MGTLPSLLHIVFASNQPYIHTSVKKQLQTCFMCDQQTQGENYYFEKCSRESCVGHNQQPSTYSLVNEAHCNRMTIQPGTVHVRMWHKQFHSTVYMHRTMKTSTIQQAQWYVCVYSFTSVTKNRVCMKQTEQVQQTQHQKYTLNRVPCGLCVQRENV